MRFLKAFFILVALVGTLPAGGACDTMDELLNRFQTEYDGLEPPPNSSVYGDFKLERVMIGSAYTVRGLKLIHEQNLRLEEKYDLMLEKYEEILGQNREMIDLLKIIAEGLRKD